MAYWSPWGYIEDPGSVQAFYFFEEALYTIAGSSGGYTNGCELSSVPDGYDLSLYLTSEGSMLFRTDVPIGGFQFTFTEGVITDASGGSAASENFMMTHSDTMMLSFSLSGTTVTGCGTLINLEFESDIVGGRLLSGADIVVSDGNGVALNVDVFQATSQLQLNDWIGVFKGDKCVGARKWDMNAYCMNINFEDEASCVDAGEEWYPGCGGGICEVPAGGDDGITPELSGYMQTGDFPTFRIKKSGGMQYSTVIAGGTVDAWANNEAFVYDYILASGVVLDYNLRYGMQLISFPTNMTETAIATLFPNTAPGSIIEQLISEGQSAGYENNQWIGTLMNLSPLDGYWIRANGDYNFTINGSFMPNPTYSIHNGSNLISYPGHEAMLLADAIPSEIYLNNKMYGIIGEGIACIWDQSQNSFVGSLTYLSPNKGYWFLSLDDYNLQFNLETVAGCTNIEYGTEAGCTGAGYDWVQLLGPGA